MQRLRGTVQQGRISQVQIITYVRNEGADEARQKKVGRSEQMVGGSEIQGHGP